MRSLSLLALLLLAPLARADFALDDGDRVVFLGSTLVEQEQRAGWWETALTTRFAGKKVTFRNLGWSGDTVFGESHVGFAYTRTGNANVAGGYEHLTKHALSLKPTVLVIGYGTNESFAGEAGLERFVKGLNRLLDTLAPSKARVVLLSPMRQGDMGRPLPDPAKQNKNLRLYSDAIKEVAEKRKAHFVDLYDLIGDVGKVKGASLNGIHLTDPGYRWAAPALEKGLGVGTSPWHLEIDLTAKKATAKGAKVEWIDDKTPTVRVTDDRLFPGRRTVVIKGLPNKRAALHSEKAIIGAGLDWEKGVSLDADPASPQLEKLRQAIVAKNELYFHRWRPQNETYLFGFRKHEQGNNAVEIPKFDPLIEKKEKEIFDLSKPAAYTLQVRIEE